MNRDLTVRSFQDRENWLRARAGDPGEHTIGASEAAAILDVMPDSYDVTPWSVWNRKMLGDATEETDAMRRGQDWEPAVLRSYQRESGNIVVDPAAQLRCENGIVLVYRESMPWLRVSPDAFAHRADAPGQVGLVEAKTAANTSDWTPQRGLVVERWDDTVEDLIPRHYAVQVYVQMAVTGVEWVDLCALVPENRWLGLRYVRLLADPEVQNAIVSALAAWRERHLLGGEPPPIDGSSACTAALVRKFATPKTRPIRVATEEQAAWMHEFVQVKARIADYEARADELRNRLLAACSDGSKLLLDGAKPQGPYMQAQRAGGGSRIDADMLRSRYPKIAAECETTATAGVALRDYRF